MPFGSVCPLPDCFDGLRLFDREGVMFDPSRAAAPGQPPGSGGGGDDRVGYRAAGSGVYGQCFGFGEVARVEPEDMQSSRGRAVAFGGRGRPRLCRDGYRDGFVREERQFVALAVRDQADERH